VSTTEMFSSLHVETRDKYIESESAQGFASPYSGDNAHAPGENSSDGTPGTMTYPSPASTLSGGDASAPTSNSPDIPVTPAEIDPKQSVPYALPASSELALALQHRGAENVVRPPSRGIDVFDDLTTPTQDNSHDANYGPSPAPAERTDAARTPTASPLGGIDPLAPVDPLVSVPAYVDYPRANTGGVPYAYDGFALFAGFGAPPGASASAQEYAPHEGIDYPPPLLAPPGMSGIRFP